MEIVVEHHRPEGDDRDERRRPKRVRRERTRVPTAIPSPVNETRLPETIAIGRSRWPALPERSGGRSGRQQGVRIVAAPAKKTTGRVENAIDRT